MKAIKTTPSKNPACSRPHGIVNNEVPIIVFQIANLTKSIEHDN